MLQILKNNSTSKDIFIFKRYTEYHMIHYLKCQASGKFSTYLQNYEVWYALKVLKYINLEQKCDLTD